MSASMQSDQQFEDLKLQIEHISRAHRRVARSVDGSGVVLRHALSAGRRRRVAARRGIMILLSAVALLAVALQARWIPEQAPAPPVQAPSHPVPAAPALTSHPLVIHVQATRPCRVRLVVDGTELDWRPLRSGDQFFSRPQRELIIQSDDAGALSTTVNGRPISLGLDGQAIAVRLTSKHPFAEPAPAP